MKSKQIMYCILFLIIIGVLYYVLKDQIQGDVIENASFVKQCRMNL